jgi:hypothetical protein
MTTGRINQVSISQRTVESKLRPCADRNWSETPESHWRSRSVHQRGSHRSHAHDSTPEAYFVAALALSNRTCTFVVVAALRDLTPQSSIVAMYPYTKCTNTNPLKVRRANSTTSTLSAPGLDRLSFREPAPNRRTTESMSKCVDFQEISNFNSFSEAEFLISLPFHIYLVFCSRCEIAAAARLVTFDRARRCALKRIPSTRVTGSVCDNKSVGLGVRTSPRKKRGLQFA